MHRAVSLFQAGLLLCGLLSLPGEAAAQAWPSKTIRVINPFAAGGFGELIVRPLMERVSKVLGQSIVLESQAGANGTIASTTVARAAPDGHTLLLANLGPQVISPLLQPDLPYDPVKDFEPVSMIGMFPVVLAVHPTYVTERTYSWACDNFLVTGAWPERMHAFPEKITEL